jgi:hypothetical protein
MNRDEIQAAQSEWGDKPCDHPDIIAESDAKPGEDNWRCLQCAKAMDYDEWRRLHNNRGLER